MTSDCDVGNKNEPRLSRDRIISAMGKLTRLPVHDVTREDSKLFDHQFRVVYPEQ